MANCQNNMRYSRQGNMYQQRSSCANQWQVPVQRDTKRCGEERMPEQRNTGCHNGQRMSEQRDMEHRMAEHREMHMENKTCGCEHHKDELAGMTLAMAYVPWQKWRDIYDICEGFQRGTIFAQLDMPFKGRGGCNR